MSVAADARRLLRRESPPQCVDQLIDLVAQGAQIVRRGRVAGLPNEIAHRVAVVTRAGDCGIERGLRHLARRTLRAAIALVALRPLRPLLAFRSRRTAGIALRPLWTFRPLRAGIANRALRTLYSLRANRPLRTGWARNTLDSDGACQTLNPLRTGWAGGRRLDLVVERVELIAKRHGRQWRVGGRKIGIKGHKKCGVRSSEWRRGRWSAIPVIPPSPLRTPHPV